MTYNSILTLLRTAGIQDAEFEAATLVCHFTGMSRASLLLKKDSPLTSPALESAVLRRAKDRFPLQYILGEWGFGDRTFTVSPDCLIPRPDTELLVETAIERLPQNAYFLDIGCGSGCIAISVLLRRPDTHATAIDISAGAVGLARQNAARCGVADRLNFIVGDMRDTATRHLSGTPDGLLSNPPYIPSDEVDRLAPELAYEPRIALDGGRDGLDFYRTLVGDWSDILPKGGLMIFETGAGQTAAIAELADEHGFSREIFYDIEHRDRVILLKKE